MLGKTNGSRIAERREATRREILDAAWAVARERGLAQLTLRDIAERMGMRTPSLYSHVESKNAIYDAMFAQAWSECRDDMEAALSSCPADTPGALRHHARVFFDFAVSDLARHQLMNQRTIPGFEPTPAAYEPAVTVLARFREQMAGHGITDQGDIDLYIAIVGGLIDAQLANDPGGSRWSLLLDRAIDMYARDLGISPGPGSTTGERSSG
jgi:AcrR family transcriptional regulator